MPSSNPLPPKENALFKRILKCYEQKQYKNGLKFAKQILSNPKFQEHGETLAMKGLTLNNLGRKEEAYDYVRRGLRADLRSHVCWHVYGLLQRSDKKYDEAIKCYRNALKWDNDNIQILRDLSLLQIQMRDLDGYKETRYQLFQLRPTQRASWIGFAMSYHLLHDYDMALKILEEFRKTQQKAAYDYEHSELLLYQNMVLQEAGNTEQALEHLDTYQHQICDKVALLETRARFYMEIQKDKSEEERKKLQSKAADIYRGLIKRNPENHDYYTKLAEAADAQSEEKHLAIYTEYRAMFPKAQAPQRLPLNVANGGSFRELVDTYLKKALRKGVPPLFVDLRPLYEDSKKVAVIEELCLSYASSLKSDEGSFDAGGQKEPATALLWVYYFLAQHYDHKKDYQKAFEMLEAAISHTPTLIELFLLKGKLFKHVGDIDSAVQNLDEAQSLDTADRYINCKCAKYMLRANKVKEAEEMCQKFTREGVPAMENLNEMQCMWFQTECALAYQRMDRFGDSLKKCIEVDRHFTEIIEDQFDFHTYCMRKMTLRSYVELLRLEDVLRTHRFYKKAAHCAINVYLRLYDQPLQDVDELGELNTENMSPSELKKLRNKQKKAKRKAEAEKANAQQAQQRKEAHNKSQKKGPGGEDELDAPQKDELIPEKLERPQNPLEEALKFLTPLQNLAKQDIDTHFTAFEIYYRKGKPLLMLRSIKRAKLLLEEQSKSDPRMHGCVVRFQKFVTDKMSTFGDAVQKVLMNETKNIFTTKTTRERNEEFMQKHSKEYQYVVEGARLIALLDSEKTEHAVNLLCKMDSTYSGVDIKTCSDVYDALIRGDFGKAGKSVAETYRKKCQELFQYASKFKDPSSNSSNHNSVTPSKNNTEKQSKVISNSGEPISSKKHVNNSMDINKSNSKQITAGSGSNAQTEP